MTKNIENGKKYLYNYDNLIDCEKYMVINAHYLFTQNNDLDNAFLEKHCTFDNDGECNYDYDMNKDEVWQDFRDMHQIANEIEKIQKDSLCLEVRNENDLSEVFYNNKPLNQLETTDFTELKIYFNLKSTHYGSFSDDLSIYTIELGNGEVKAILFEEDSEIGNIYKVNELLDYLNENYPERDEFNYLNHTLSPQSNDVKLLMMNHKDSDSKLNSDFFLIDKKQYEEYKSGSRRLEDVSVYDNKLEYIRNKSEIADLHNTIVLDYQKTQENKLTADKMQSLVDRHSPTSNEPKQDARKTRRNKI